MKPKYPDEGSIAAQVAVWPLGALPTEQGVSFCVWAPRARSVSVVLFESQLRVPLQPLPHGYFAAMVKEAQAGTKYKYFLDNERELPDPVSRHQPEGVHGASLVVDPASFAWTDGNWRGLPFDAYVIYELHVGTFTPEGTFDAAIAKLPYLRDLGITAVELMPVNQCPGARNWGYDGAYLFAPQHSYGGPEGLKRFVDACHREGLACVMDVVYNHMGPEGTYVGMYGPYFTERYQTPWGAALNLDDAHSDPVRRFFLDNALFWLTEYHCDALRLDAIHGIFDFSAHHILAEMKALVAEEAKRQARPLHLIAESDLNDVRVINPQELGGHGMDAQWSDDFHHALFTALGAPREGYFSDFGKLSDLQQTIKEGFVYGGKFSPHRKRRHGNSAADRPGHQFVVYTQNHDQVANGSQGVRMSVRMNAAKERLAAAVLLTAPNTPMLFMGQEYGETKPFSYFVDHGDPELCRAVREGRKAEFEAFGFERDFEDPTQIATFEHCKLDWDKLLQPPHAQMLQLYRDLLRLRSQHSALRSDDRRLVEVVCNEAQRWITVTRHEAGGARVMILANFSEQPIKLPHLSAFAVPLLATDEARYGGDALPLAERLVAADPQLVSVSPWSAVLLSSKPA